MGSRDAPSITPFLMFTGKAEEAMELYTSVFPDARVEEITRYGPDGPGGAAADGTVELALFTINGQTVRCTDSFMEQDFSFTPSFSFFVTCGSEGELDGYVGALAKGGKFLMPADNYGFSTKFCWLEDRFGVSWQLNLP